MWNAERAEEQKPSVLFLLCSCLISSGFIFTLDAVSASGGNRSTTNEKENNKVSG